MAWADQEEAKELKESTIPNDQKEDWKPSEEDKKWMEEEMRKAKELYGEDFGEDIKEDFEGG